MIGTIWTKDFPHNTFLVIEQRDLTRRIYTILQDNRIRYGIHIVHEEDLKLDGWTRLL